MHIRGLISAVFSLHVGIAVRITFQTAAQARVMGPGLVWIFENSGVQLLRVLGVRQAAYRDTTQQQAVQV
jgi:hypothetical protein